MRQKTYLLALRTVFWCDSDSGATRSTTSTGEDECGGNKCFDETLEFTEGRFGVDTGAEARGDAVAVRIF